MEIYFFAKKDGSFMILSNQNKRREEITVKSTRQQKTREKAKKNQKTLIQN